MARTKTNEKYFNLINQGFSINEIRKFYPKFPEELDQVETFLRKIGYTSGTAKKYVSILRKNNKEKEVSDNETIEVLEQKVNQLASELLEEKRLNETLSISLQSALDSLSNTEVICEKGNDTLKKENDSLKLKIKNMENSMKFYQEKARTNSNLNSDSDMANDRFKEYLEEANSFYLSKNADYKNVIIDTCIYAHDEIIKVLNKAESVTIIYSVIQEIDEIKNRNRNSLLGKNLREAVKNIFMNPTKYLLSNYSGNNQYVDENILDYIDILPEKIKPTLLTADQTLAVKAKTKGLEYILYTPPMK